MRNCTSRTLRVLALEKHPGQRCQTRQLNATSVASGCTFTPLAVESCCRKRTLTQGPPRRRISAHTPAPPPLWLDSRCSLFRVRPCSTCPVNPTAPSARNACTCQRSPRALERTLTLSVLWRLLRHLPGLVLLGRVPRAAGTMDGTPHAPSCLDGRDQPSTPPLCRVAGSRGRLGILPRVPASASGHRAPGQHTVAGSPRRADRESVDTPDRHPARSALREREGDEGQAPLPNHGVVG